MKSFASLGKNSSKAIDIKLIKNKFIKLLTSKT